MRTVHEVPLRAVPVVEPEAALDEAIQLMRDEPLKTVILVGDGTYMGMFNQDALDALSVPGDVDRSTLAVGPYVHPVRVIAAPNMPVDQVLHAMRHRGLSVIPVVHNNIYQGVVTQTDLEAALA